MLPASLAFIDGLGTPEMILIFVIVLVLFGGQKLPEFARGLGKSIREFKKAAAGVEEEFKRALEQDERKHTTPQIAAAASTALITAPAAHGDVHGDSPGPELPVYDHDEYGNEMPRPVDGSSDESMTHSVPDTVPAETPVHPAAPLPPPYTGGEGLPAGPTAAPAPQLPTALPAANPPLAVPAAHVSASALAPQFPPPAPIVTAPAAHLPAAAPHLPPPETALPGNPTGAVPHPVTPLALPANDDRRDAGEPIKKIERP